jgi:hypothetical protein
MTSTAIQDDRVQYQQKLDEENIAALQASAEAISISRVTLETTLAQSEQLQHCEDIHERNKYIVEKSGRIVRGMTWSGWMMNTFSKNSEPPTDKSVSRRADTDGMKEHVDSTTGNSVSSVLTESEINDLPQELRNPACMLQNYECNVLLLEKCQNKQEYDTCLEICKKLHSSAKQAISDLDGSNAASINGNRLSGRSIQLLRRLGKKIDEVYDQQYGIVQRIGHRFQTDIQASEQNRNPNSFANQKANRLWGNTQNSALQQRIDKQDKHLDALAGSIQELMHNGAAIGATFETQNQLLEKLGTETDDLTEHTKMVSRRADRLSHRSVRWIGCHCRHYCIKFCFAILVFIADILFFIIEILSQLWRKPKDDFKYRVAIQHVKSKRYLSVEPHHKNKIALHETLHPDMGVFDIHERRESRLVGFKNNCTGTWLGQSTLGSIMCHAKNFGRNEEWELDDGAMTRTRLLCASANWGNGGWLEADNERKAFSIGDYTVDAKRNASEWSILVLGESSNSE